MGEIKPAPLPPPLLRALGLVRRRLWLDEVIKRMCIFVDANCGELRKCGGQLIGSRAWRILGGWEVKEAMQAKASRSSSPPMGSGGLGQRGARTSREEEEEEETVCCWSRLVRLGLATPDAREQGREKHAGWLSGQGKGGEGKCSCRMSAWGLESCKGCVVRCVLRAECFGCECGCLSLWVGA